MIRRGRHVTDDQLADYAAEVLSHRKVRKVVAHLAECEQCREVSRQLEAVPTILASAGTQYPPLPASVSIRIEAVLRVEATQRLATLPATEGGRGDLPARHRRRADPSGWRLPGLSVPATRLVAAGGALVIVGAASFAIISGTGTGTGTTGSTQESLGSAVGRPSIQRMSLGPDVTYGRPGALHTVHSYQSSADFAPAKLTTEAVDAVRASRAQGVSPSLPAFTTPAPSRAQTSSGSGSAAPSAGTASRLGGCIDLIAPGRIVLLIDRARFSGTPATIIVIAALGVSPAEAWAVGSGCSASSKDILGHVLLGNI